MINRVNEDYYHYLMYVVYVVDKQDKIILNHHYQRYFHLEENKNRNIENLIKKKSKGSD
jgi:4-diphosphocytidyl-2C-methyl-D-erythritol kinase